MSLKIRFAHFEDLNSIVAIYNQSIEIGCITADLNPICPKDRKIWFLEHDSRTYPIYIAENENFIIGWGALSPYRKGREGLREVAEISYYLDCNYHGQGYGRELVQYIIGDCDRLGLKHLFALLLETNIASSTFLDKLGFTRWGFMPEVVNLKGIRCGHVIYGKSLEKNTDKKEIMR